MKQVEISVDDQRWADAGAFISAHGAEWPDIAFERLKAASASTNYAEFERWIDLMEKMTAIAEMPRQ